MFVRVEAVSGRVSSEVTGLEFVIVEGRLRVRDPATAKLLLTAAEAAALRRAEVAQAEVEARAARLEEEVERLRSQLQDRRSQEPDSFRGAPHNREGISGSGSRLSSRRRPRGCSSGRPSTQARRSWATSTWAST